MSFLLQYQEVRTKVLAIVGGMPVSWPNETYTPVDLDTQWLEFAMDDIDANQLTIGASTNYHRTDGLIKMKLFTKQNISTGTALSKAQTICDALRNWSGTYIQCFEAWKKDVGQNPNNFYQTNIFVRYKFDELH